LPLLTSAISLLNVTGRHNFAIPCRDKQVFLVSRGVGPIRLFGHQKRVSRQVPAAGPSHRCVTLPAACALPLKKLASECHLALALAKKLNMEANFAGDFGPALMPTAHSVG